MDDTDGRPAVGESLRRLRMRAGMNQADLAAKAGVSVRALRNVEAGNVGRPHAASLSRLAYALGLPAGGLVASGASGAPGTPGASRVGLRVEVLGPLTLRRDDAIVDVNSVMQRSLLGLLAVQPGRVVGAQEIVDLLWPDEPPRTCLQLVHTYIGQVRRLLEPERRAGAPTGPPTASPAGVLRRTPGGYRLDLAPEQSDLVEFGRLAAEAGRAWSDGAAQSAVRLHHDAWSRWRGPVLAGSDARLREHPAAIAAAQQRIAAVQEWTDAALSLADYEDIIGPLRILHAEEPLHEGLAARLMQALAGSGQQAAALSLFETVRERLDSQLGMPPGAELRASQLSVLRGRLPVAARPAKAGSPSLPVPAELPTDVAGFTGRAEQLAVLDALLGARPGDGATDLTADLTTVPIRVAAIVGTGGVGKTALAVRWAHRVRDRFPDGQLYVNLRAHAAEGPLRPIEALTGFLLALGTPADRVPGDEDQAAALYRSRLAGRRVLVVLDNAASAEQVRPLLPAAPGSLVVVTGRDRMAGLIARDGARLVTLDVLAPDQAVTLLGQILGTTRIAAEPAATAELARLCAHLPLALRIAAANLAGRPRHPIADYVAKLVGGDRLGALAIDGDAATAVRATFEASCDALPAAERRLFRLLGLAPGPDITARSAAALAQTSPGAGVDADEAERLLDRLTSRHLVDEHLPGRYSMHDLLRLHAAELADAEEDDTSRAAALRALARHYYADLVTASQLLYPHLLHLPEPENTCAAADDGAGDGARVRFPDGPAAMSWIDAERANLVALIGRLGQQGHHSEVWRLADRLNGYFVLQKNSVDWQNVAEAAHASALADGDLTAQAGAELHLGMADDALGRIDSAATHYTCSAELSRQAGWTACQAVAINNLARHSWLSARVDETIARLTSALVLHRESGRKAGEAVTLANLATAHQERARELEDASEPSEHDRAEARRLFAEALNLHREIGDRRNEGDTLRLLAEVNRDSGDHLRALRQTEQALRIVRGDGDRRFEVYALSTLATIRAIHGENESALNGHAEAVRLARELGDPRVQTQILLDLAQTHARLGRPDDALVPLREAVALARQIGSWLLERQARRIERLVQAADPVRPVSDSADPLSRRDPAVLV